MTDLVAHSQVDSTVTLHKAAMLCLASVTPPRPLHATPRACHALYMPHSPPPQLYRPSPESFLRFNRNAVPYLIQWGIIALVIYRVFYRELESTLYEIKRQLRRALGMGRPAHPAPGSAGERAREVRREAEEAGRREQQMRAEEVRGARWAVAQGTALV